MLGPWGQPKKHEKTQQKQWWKVWKVSVSHGLGSWGLARLPGTVLGFLQKIQVIKKHDAT